ncbi:LytTR family transcriptional regulator [Undibacterium piscinae]|uniref:LytTR family transcriptional regulator n=1 Tax=Undibacterium piscinae TaxID=2495591 RepID=A0A6M4A712_9BURK|nr:LytTR family transcriptional regulator [Undibacterium piscinae]
MQSRTTSSHDHCEAAEVVRLLAEPAAQPSAPRYLGGFRARCSIICRVRERLLAAQPAPDIDVLLDKLEQRLQKKNAAEPLRRIRAMVGQELRLIPVDEIDFLRSDEKYTLIAWRNDEGKIGEALIRTPLKELLAQLDAEHFIQVHRSVVVNLRAISHVTRGEALFASLPADVNYLFVKLAFCIVLVNIERGAGLKILRKHDPMTSMNSRIPQGLLSGVARSFKPRA